MDTGSIDLHFVVNSYAKGVTPVGKDRWARHLPIDEYAVSSCTLAAVRVAGAVCNGQGCLVSVSIYPLQSTPCTNLNDVSGVRP